MGLIAGTRLGPYEIQSPLGAGGMGEVYRARDAKLNRDVAIKVLLPAVANDPDRLARFSREAQVLASLNHPNIAHIYGVEEASDVTALVMELVDGEDLAARLHRGAIPIDEALPIARQIAEALEAAHDHGIIHRDLKPANVKVRPDGTVKVLDFSLAKAVGQGSGIGDQGSASAANSPTLSLHATEAGVILGTPAYMSPEQARGRVVDKRTDIWAFAVVLFEMLTGKRLFPGDDSTDTIVAVLSKDPDWRALPPSVPAGIRQLLRRSLEKDPRRRLDSAAAARIEIDEALTPPTPASLASPRNNKTTVLPWTLAGLLGAALVTGLVLWEPWRTPSATPPGVMRITLSMSQDNSLSICCDSAISPDGRMVAFAARSAQGQYLYLRRLDEWEPRLLPGTDGAANPFFSPDGRWIAFARAGGLERILVAGGPPQPIAKAGGLVDGRWRTDSTIVFTDPGGLWRVSSEGGTPELLKRPSDHRARYLHPEPLPNGAILFTTHQEGQTRIAVLPAGAETPRVIVESGGHPRHLPSGHLAYVADGHLYAVPFDADRMEIRGGAIAVVDDVFEERGLSYYDVATNGSLVYRAFGSSATTIVWKDRQGVTIPVVTRPREYGAPALSPDGQRLSVMIREGASRNVWTGRVDDGQLTRLTRTNDDWFGVWSPDGRRIAYGTLVDNTYNVFLTLVNGAGKAERLTESPNWQQATSWSPNGDTLLFHDGLNSIGYDIWEYSVSSRQSRAIVKTASNEQGAKFSPDGRWLAYMSDESGQNEIYVQAYPGPGIRRRVSTDGGSHALWSHSGRELFYQTATAMMAVPILDARELQVGAPRRLFVNTRIDRAAISADDQRFLMLERSAVNQLSQLNLVQNWFADLRARVPVK